MTRRNFLKTVFVGASALALSGDLLARNDGRIVNSVTGPMNVKDFGPTLMHEHVAIVDAFMRQAFPDWLDTEKLLAVVLPQLEKLRDHGIKTIFDATPIDLGRDVKIIAEVAKRSGFNILASTGMYYYETDWNRKMDAKWLAKRYLGEIRDGIQGTTVKAALIKCATDRQGVIPCNKIMLEAAARASAESDTPILTHTFVWTKNGLDQLKFLLNAGAQAKRIVIGHSGDSNDLDYLQRLLDQGVYLGMDRFGCSWLNSTENRIDTIVKLVGKGYVNQLMLSHDSSFYNDGGQPLHRDRYVKQGDHNVFRISEQVLPKLREKGVSEADINLMMCGNVQRLFL